MERHKHQQVRQITALPSLLSKYYQFIRFIAAVLYSLKYFVKKMVGFQISVPLLLVVVIQSILVSGFNVFPSTNRILGSSRQLVPVSSQIMQYKTMSRLNMMAAAEFDWKGVKKQTEEKMGKCLESMQQQFNTVRAGAANPALLDRVTVDYYGAATPLSQVARVSVSGSQSLIIDPFEKNLIKEIEKAILTSKLNLNPTNDGSIVRINLPPITEERRKEMVKQVKGLAEEGKVAIRNVRRDFLEKIKQAEKDKQISKDMSKDYQVKGIISSTY